MATINGTNGGDSLYGGAAADVINGLNGNDTLKGFGGADRLDGGNGIDTVFYGDSSAGVGINLATGRGVGGSAEGDTLWPAPGSEDTELGVILEPEVVYGTQTLCTRVQA